ncbi:MAG: menaquinone biosynthesis protein [Thermodesulfobacteriota bacterium]|nr:menaquinone biosynthesis protein [Thermodesulfobacteriota bacterium]
MESTRVGRIRYINVAPVYHGFDSGRAAAPFSLISRAPATLNSMILNSALDISPVSSIAYARHHSHLMVLPGLSISCFGDVMSVLLASRFPIDQLDGKTIVFSSESETAVGFLRLYFAQKKIAPVFVATRINSPEDRVCADAAGVLTIGDLALTGEWERRFDHVWDIGRLWQELAGRPFVFSLWVVRRAFAEARPDVVAEILKRFHASKQKGLARIDQVIARAAGVTGLDVETCRRYYRLLQYDLGPEQIAGAEAFFDMLFAQGMLAEAVRLSFFDPQS